MVVLAMATFTRLCLGEVWTCDLKNGKRALYRCANRAVLVKYLPKNFQILLNEHGGHWNEFMKNYRTHTHTFKSDRLIFLRNIRRTFSTF